MNLGRWHQVDKVLEAALEREPGERAAFLDQACAGDEALRQEVEELLKAHEQAGSFLSPPTLEATTQETAIMDAQSLLARTEP